MRHFIHLFIIGQERDFRTIVREITLELLNLINNFRLQIIFFFLLVLLLNIKSVNTKYTTLSRLVNLTFQSLAGSIWSTHTKKIK